MSIFSQPDSFTIIFFAVFGILALNILILIAFGVLLSSFLKRYLTWHETIEEQKKEAYKKAAEVLDQARGQAGIIIQDAQHHASGLLKNAGSSVERVEKEIGETIRAFVGEEKGHIGSVVDDLLRTYRAMVGEAEKHFSDTLEGAAKTVAGEARNSVAHFQDLLKGETVRYHAIMEQRIEEWRMKAQQEIDDRRREAFKKIEESMYRIILFVSQRVLGRALTMEDHQQLVIQALEEAKKQGFFD